MKRGEIYWVELPAAGGREQHGRRPAIVIQDETQGSGLPTVLVIPLSNSQAALRFSGTVLIAPSAENGLRAPSVALVFQLRAVDRQRIRERVGQIDDATLPSIFAEFDKLCGRP